MAWSRQFAQVITEILVGARSPRQLVPLTTERVRDRIGLLTQTLTADQKPTIRRIVTSPYPHAITYTVGDGEIIVLGVRHTARRPLP